MPATAQDEASLRAADLAQLQAARAGDADAIEAMTLVDQFVINNPLGETGTGERMVARFRSGEIAHEQFERLIERLSITGDVGVVMGREIVQPSPSSLEGGGIERGTVLRRFTNVWLWRDGGWRWLARHANEVHEFSEVQ
jgi:ketosteroid isomerase-like protein